MSSSADWDREAATFDEAADHGLRDPEVRASWQRLLAAHLTGPGMALDIGCGTGSLSLLLAELGYGVTGIDLSPRMVELARAKAGAAGHPLQFSVGDAADPRPANGPFDVVLGRHILWALPDLRDALVRWTSLLRPGGRLVMIEGFWHTGVGLHRADLEAALPANLAIVAATELGADASLWGGAVGDERYLLVAERRA